MADGDAEEARRSNSNNSSLHPQWEVDPRREIGKMITSQILADRLIARLAAAGLQGSVQS